MYACMREYLCVYVHCCVLHKLFRILSLYWSLRALLCYAILFQYRWLVDERHHYTRIQHTRARKVCSSCCTFRNCFSLTILPLQLFPLSSLFLSFFFLKYEIYKHPPCNALFYNSEFLLYRTVSFNKNIITCYIFCSLFFFLSIFSSTLFLPLPLSLLSQFSFL